jgi:phytoene synthase
MHDMAPAEAFQLDAQTLAECERTLRAGSKTFYVASILLPPRVRRAATALYAFCRVADDAVDCPGENFDPVMTLRARLDAIYARQTLPGTVDHAFSCVVHAYSIPRLLPLALIEGFEWDMQQRQYATVTDLYGYAARVAGSVGVMMSLIMGVRSPSALAYAAEMGAAMQLTNIARDVGEDSQMGRVYLPAAWLYEVGISPQALLERPEYSPALATVVTRLLKTAHAMYDKSRRGVGLLPRACRPAIAAASMLYAEIGAEVRRNGADSVSRRAVVRSSRKAALLAQAYVTVPWPHYGRTAVTLRTHDESPAQALRFLVDCVAAHDRDHAVLEVPQDVRVLKSARHQQNRIVWLLELFERLERQDRERAAARA